MAHTYLAAKTLEAIDKAVEADGGNLYRHYLEQVLPHIGDAYRQDEKPFRSHMGASQIGGKCARQIWYGFHWVTEPDFPGRVLRLFNRGHLEEGRFIALLLMIGCQVYQQDNEGNQYRISHAGGHAGGSGDGIVVGLPDLPPGTAALSEFKTHGEKSFNDLKKNGVRQSKHEHYVQCNVYARKMGLDISFYLAVNKNTDELYAELLPLDIETADRFLDRMDKLVFMQEAPQKISQSPSWYECKFCDFRNVCHKKKPPAINCRTCIHANPEPDGTWSCNVGFGAVEIDTDAQLAACDKWELNQNLYL